MAGGNRSLEQAAVLLYMTTFALFLRVASIRRPQLLMVMLFTIRKQGRLLSRVAAAGPAQADATYTVELASLADADSIPIAKASTDLEAVLPSTPGIYAVYDLAGQLQYIGLSRKVCSQSSGRSARCDTDVSGDVISSDGLWRALTGQSSLAKETGICCKQCSCR